VKNIKYFFLLLIFTFVVITPTAHADLFYVEGLNDNFTASPNVYHMGTSTSYSGPKETSYGWSPENSFELAKIEIYTLETEQYPATGSFTITLRNDTDGTPGDILQTASFDLAGDSGFFGAEFDTPVALSAEDTYWVGYYHYNTLGSHLAGEQDATDLNYYLISNPGENSPELSEYAYGPSSPMMKFYAQTAVPVPAAVWLLGSGLLGMVGIRRKNRG
jgi:hypothetical protein